MGIFSALAVLILAVGGYLAFSVLRPGTASSQPLSASHLSLPGISVEPPQGWTRFPSAGPGTLVMAPAGATNSCPDKPVNGPARCIEAVTLSRNNPALLNVGSAEQAAQLLVSGRFSSLHSSIRYTTSLSRESFTENGCPVAFSEWRVSWTAPPDTIEGYAVVRTNIAYQNNHFASVFIRLTAHRDDTAQALAQKIVSSIRCN